MRLLITGGDGYLGWPTAMHFAARGDEVWVIDNYLRRTMALDTCSEALLPTPNLIERAKVYEKITGIKINVVIGDCADYQTMDSLFRENRFDAVVHYAEQPSAPYSMRGHKEASLTLHNNLGTTMTLIQCIMTHAPDCHVIKLGTMGEYGTPNIDIEEGWLEIEHKGRKDKFLFPRQAGSLYHTTKVMDTDLLWFYVRTFGLRVTDLMQGPVYGLSTPQADLDPRLSPNFHYDDIFGTVLNRFLVQAVAGIPLTVYGKGGQTRGYLNLLDTLQCVQLAADNPAEQGKMAIYNQFTETFSVNRIAEMIAEAAAELSLSVDVQYLDNPRKELEDHYYNPAHSALKDLGLQPHYCSKDILVNMLEIIRSHQSLINKDIVMPRVRWKK